MNTSDVTGPLRELLRQDGEWSWRELQDSAFQKLKDAVSSPPVLQYFDVTKPVVLSADASQHGLGAVCLQQGAPVAFASRALTPTRISVRPNRERNVSISICDTEVSRLYLWPIRHCGNRSPASHYNPQKAIAHCSARLQSHDAQAATVQSQCDYKRGKELFVTDALSRAHLLSTEPPLTDDLLEVMTLKVSRRNGQKNSDLSLNLILHAKDLLT